MKLIYIAGPYTARTRVETSAHVQRAREAAAEVAGLGLGLFPVCPHLLGDGYEDARAPGWWYAGTLELMRRCDAVLLLEGWRESKGARLEAEAARMAGLPLVHAAADLPDALGLAVVVSVARTAAEDDPLRVPDTW